MTINRSPDIPDEYYQEMDRFNDDVQYTDITRDIQYVLNDYGYDVYVFSLQEELILENIRITLRLQDALRQEQERLEILRYEEAQRIWFQSEAQRIYALAEQQRAQEAERQYYLRAERQYYARITRQTRRQIMYKARLNRDKARILNLVNQQPPDQIYPTAKKESNKYLYKRKNRQSRYNFTSLSRSVKRR